MEEHIYGDTEFNLLFTQSCNMHGDPRVV